MEIKSPRIIHPFLLAVFPVLFLFAHNIYEVPVIDVLLPIVVVTVITLVVFLSLRLITKSYSKSGMITSLLLLLFFSYGHVSNGVTEIFGLVKGTLLLGCLWLAVFVTGSILILRSHRSFSLLHRTLNVIAFTLIGISIINIGIQALSIQRADDIDTTAIVPTEDIEIPSLTASNKSPDIYYIIIDSYARQTTLEEIFGYDNSPFLDYLADNGFYIACRSRSNYAHSTLSLASSLNLKYINYLSETMGMESEDSTPLIRLIANNEVVQFLKARGYHCIFISDGYFSKGEGKYDDVYLPDHGAFGLGMTNFAVALLQTTALEPFRTIVGADSRRDILYVFDTLGDMPEVTGPKFIMVHSRGVHTPLVFDRYGGSTVSLALHATNEAAYYQHGYVEQLIFINKKLRETIDEILLKSQTAPIIILQADHGPSATIEIGARLDELTESQLNERMNILNAYLLPENTKQVLYESITPVNSFRVVFNEYFGTDYSLLKDESYYSNPDQPFKFRQVRTEEDS